MRTKNANFRYDPIKLNMVQNCLNFWLKLFGFTGVCYPAKLLVQNYIYSCVFATK